MRKAETLQDFQALAEDAIQSNREGKIYLNQSNEHFEEPLLSDEDTAGRTPMQVLRFIFKTENETIVWEYPFSETSELEEVNLQLEPIYEHFPKQVIELDEAKRLIRVSEQDGGASQRNSL
ncbi:hypothetical protein NCCP2222_00690 [Sporosarcina sp. NCCP-2222]|uniref:hypothetical protein n=1 Tax=Sporosarcina sp. NCCP-2222 TaxID=2935073 RepID=UPI002088EB3E|nr:hypothetical protein [Sporosarcina sp. NCCP-2222]GKV54122.1 hypothetical protein NCCP2222_00690 [Sporosarcina sp. NCCP-2222]